MDALTGRDLAQIAAVGVDGRDLLVAVGVEEVEGDATTVRSPVREEARPIGQLAHVRAVGPSPQERALLGRGVELAVDDRAVLTRERGVGGGGPPPPGAGGANPGGGG